MSFVTSRVAGSSTSLLPTRTVCAAISLGAMQLESRRGFKLMRRRWKVRDEGKKKTTARDETGRLVQKAKAKLPPLFTPLPVQNLDSPIFQVNERAEIGYPQLRPNQVTRGTVAQAMEFVTSSDNPRGHFGLPKNIWKDFRLLSKPCSVIRDTTVDIIESLHQATERSSEDTRLVLTGRPGCGKSYLLLQAAEYCAASGWIVIYIPRAVNLVNSTTPYSYDLRTQTFFQPEASYQILHRAKAANATLFRELNTQSPLIMEGAKNIPAGRSLYELVDLPREEVARAPIVLDKLMTELQAQTLRPVLLAVDDFQSLFCRTAYRDPLYKPVASYHLQAPRTLLDFASGRRTFAKGAFVGALNASDPAYNVTLELSEALGLPTTQPVAPWPYVNRSRFLFEYAEGMTRVEVPARLSVQEAGSIFEIWMKHRMLSSKAHDELFMSKYVESGGNARDFVWKGLLATLES